MTDEQALEQGGISPSEFMRGLRPELYSDSAERSRYELDRPTLEYHLETLTARNQTQAFEIFCKKLCERTVCPNLRPATGPEGGGDSKADTETLPLADELSTLLYMAEANAGQERWAFAFSAKERWTNKARADVAAAVGTGRGYQKIFFVTSRFARSRDRARLEDELTDKHGVRVIILDRTWIVEQVIDRDHRDLAVNYLSVGSENRDSRLGPHDYSRVQQLEDLERALADPQAFVGLPWQRASEALAAAKLSRSLERPRHETEGRFVRAIRLARSDGTDYQQLEAQYESLWTAFWWFDDFALVTREYTTFEERVLKSEHARVLEFLCNLLQLLFNAVLHKHTQAEDVDLAGRASRLRERLAQLAKDETRPNNALEATMSCLVIDANNALLARDLAELSSVWPRLSDVLERADGLGEFDAMRAVKLIEVMGPVAGPDPAYSKLYDLMVDFVSKRKSESEGAMLLLKRAKQLDFDRNFEMIRLLGKAVSQLVKKEHAEELVEATQLLALAYRSAGLLWAARAVCLLAIAAMFVDAEEESDLPASVVPTLMMLAWIAVELGDVPEVLQVIRLATVCARNLPLTQESVAHFDDRLMTFDFVFSCLLLNVPEEKLERLQQLPDVLPGLGLPHSRIWLMYALGHESVLRAEGSIPDEESPDEVLHVASELAAKMPPSRRRRPVLLNEAGPGESVTYVSGIRLTVAHEGTELAMLAAESILAAIEVVFATLPEQDVAPHVQAFVLKLRAVPGITEPRVDIATDRLSGTVSWPDATEPAILTRDGSLQGPLLTIAGSVLAATCFMREMGATLNALLLTDAAAQRLSSVTIAGNSRSRVFKGRVASLNPWLELGRQAYPLQADRPSLKQIIDPSRAPPAQSAGDRASERKRPPTPTDHRLLNVHSLIDIALWDQARWRGVAFVQVGQGNPPVMGLMFENAGPARTIFERWRSRFGSRDTKDELFISIVRALPKAPTTHYRVLVTSSTSGLDAESETGQLTSIAARMQTMTPETDENVERFLRAYERFGVYWLVPAILGPGGPPDMLADVSIMKRGLSVKSARDVGPNDIEAIALGGRLPSQAAREG